LDSSAPAFSLLRGWSSSGTFAENLDFGECAGRVIGHHTIDSPLEEALDVDRLVDDPNMDFDFEPMSRLDECRRNDSAKSVELRHL
jgi:hypothetical protein